MIEIRGGNGPSPGPKARAKPYISQPDPARAEILISSPIVGLYNRKLYFLVEKRQYFDEELEGTTLLFKL